MVRHREQLKKLSLLSLGIDQRQVCFYTYCTKIIILVNYFDGEMSLCTYVCMYIPYGLYIYANWKEAASEICNIYY